MEERHSLRKEASHAASRSAKGTWVPPGQLTASPRRDKAPREEQHGLKAAAGAQRSQPYSNGRVKAPAATQPTPKQASISTAAVKCRDTSAAAKSRSSGGGSSSAGGQGYSSNQQHQQNSTSSYTAALLKRQAAAALQGAAPGSTRGITNSSTGITNSSSMKLGSTLPVHLQQQQQQQQHGTDSLAALATKLHCMGGYSSRSAAAVAAAEAAGSPRSGNTSPRLHQQQQQQQQQHALNVCSGSRHSSSGSGCSGSSGSYAAQASSRTALLSARGAVTHRTSTDGQYTCTTVTASQQQQQQQSAAGMGAYSQQLSSALTALSAVTAANTAAAAILRAVATEAAKTAGAVSLQHAGESTSAAAGSSKPAGYHSSSRSSSSLQGQHPVVPPLQLIPQQQQQQQQQEVYQPVSTGIRLAAAQAVARISGSYQHSPAAAVAPIETAVTSAAAQAAAAAAAANGSVLASSMTAEAEAGSAAVIDTAGVTLPPIKTPAATAAIAAAAVNDSAGTEWVETPHSPAGGIGYSKLRRLLTGSCAASAAAAAAVGSPRHVEPPQEQLLPAAAAAAAAAAYTSSEGFSSETTHSSLRLRQQQRQQEEGSAGDHWTSEDVVMGWYQYSGDDEESSEQVSGVSSVPAAHTAAAAGHSPYHSPDSPRLSFQQPSGSSQTVPAAAAGTRSLTTSSGGIEYAKLLRTQTGSPAATPRQTRFQQRQQAAEIPGSSPAGGMGFRKSSEDDHSGFRMSSKLVTGWYGSGLGSESSCGNSPEPYYADPQQQTRSMYTEVPQVRGTMQYSMSSGGGAVPTVAEVTTAPAVRAGGTDSSGGWSSDGLPGWGLAPYPIVLSASGGGGPLRQAVGATLGITAQDNILCLPQQGLNLQSSFNPRGMNSAGASAGVSLGGASRTSGGGTAPLGGTVGTFDLRPCVGASLLCTRDASVTELLAASQAHVNCMESTLVSMLQVAKRWTEGGTCEPGMEESLRERFSSTF